MNFDEKTIESTRVYDGRILKLEVDKIELPNGKNSIRECVRHNGGAAVLLVKDNKIALVKQYRYVYKKAIYEIPAGKIDKGEQPIAAASRELEEETGYKAKELKLLTAIYPSPGYTDEIIYVYEAKGASFVKAHPDEGEFINCDFLPLEKVLQMINEGEICDAKTICAVYKYLYENK